MDTEKDMDAASHERFLTARMRVMEIIDNLTEALDDPGQAAAFVTSQADFERYVEAHLQFLSSLESGTVGAMQRNLVAAELWAQRGAILDMFLADNMPDR